MKSWDPRPALDGTQVSDPWQAGEEAVRNCTEPLPPLRASEYRRVHTYANTHPAHAYGHALRTHVCTHARTHAHTHAPTRTCTRTHMHTHAPTRTRAHTHACTYTHMRTHTRAHAHRQTGRCSVDSRQTYVLKPFSLKLETDAF